MEGIKRIILPMGFLAEILEAIREWDDIFKGLKK